MNDRHRQTLSSISRTDVNRHVEFVWVVRFTKPYHRYIYIVLSDEQRLKYVVKIIVVEYILEFFPVLHILVEGIFPGRLIVPPRQYPSAVILALFH